MWEIRYHAGQILHGGARVLRGVRYTSISRASIYIYIYTYGESCACRALLLRGEGAGPERKEGTPPPPRRRMLRRYTRYLDRGRVRKCSESPSLLSSPEELVEKRKTFDLRRRKALYDALSQADEQQQTNEEFIVVFTCSFRHLSAVCRACSNDTIHIDRGVLLTVESN